MYANAISAVVNTWCIWQLKMYNETRGLVNQTVRVTYNHMPDVIIKYKDSSGNITTRRISDLNTDNKESINAFCHMRNTRRTFSISNIVYAENAETGEVIEKPWEENAIYNAIDGREKLSSLTSNILPAIKALKHFSMQVRGFAKRERNHIIKFIQKHSDVSQYNSEEQDEWLHKLWVGDIYEYRDGDHTEYVKHLKVIPQSLKNEVREVAIAIARGSGRKQIPPEIATQINNDYT